MYADNHAHVHHWLPLRQNIHGPVAQARQPSGIWRCGACDEVRDMEIVNLVLDRLHKERMARADAVAVQELARKEAAESRALPAYHPCFCSVVNI